MSKRMKEYEVTSPDGKTFTVTAPEGMAQEEIVRGLLQERAKANAPKPTTSEDLTKQRRAIQDPIFRGMAGILGGIGGTYIGAYAGAPGAGGALGASSVDYAMRQLLDDDKTPKAELPFYETDLPDTGEPVGNAIVDIGANSVLNYGIGKGFEKVFKGVRGVSNMFRNSGMPETTLKLKPTYGQMNPGSLMNEIENLTLRGLKEDSIERSINLSKDVAGEIAGELAGVKTVKNLATKPTATRQAFANAIDEQTSKAFKSFVNESNLQAQNVRNIAKQRVKQIPVVSPGQPTGLLGPNGQPIVGQPTVSYVNVEGPTNTKNIVDKALQLRGEIEQIATKPDPQSPILRDLNAIIDQYGIVDPKTGKVTGYRDINFKDAWAQKIDLSDKGWGNPNRSDISITDSRYKDLYKAMSQDLDTGVADWGKGTSAEKSYALARKLVGDRNKLFDGMNITNLLNLGDVKDPSTAINKILDNSKELSKLLLQNEYKLPSGQTIVGGNKRGVLKSYQFMRMWDDANKLTDASNVKNGKVMVDNFTDTWNKFKTSQNGSMLYNQNDMKRIDDFAQAIQTATTLEGSAGASRYLGVRLATGGFRLGTAALAGLLGGGGPNMTSVAVGTGALAGMVLSARQVGKILLNNPDAAAVLTKMALGKPLGRSAVGAAQILAYALRNEDIVLETNGGARMNVKLDAAGKIKPIVDDNKLPKVEIVGGIPTAKKN